MKGGPARQWKEEMPKERVWKCSVSESLEPRAHGKDGGGNAAG